VLLFIAGLLWLLIRPILAFCRWLVFLIFGGLGRATGRAVGVGSQTMARRAARAEMAAGVAEDPLRAQNRTLSGLTVVLLAGVGRVVLWGGHLTRAGRRNA